MWQTVDVDWNKSYLLTCKEREPIMLADKYFNSIDFLYNQVVL